MRRVWCSAGGTACFGFQVPLLWLLHCCLRAQRVCLILFPSLCQHICLDCKKNFCTSCSSQPEGGPLLCHLCQRVRATAFQREELIKMKVKDLRDYLALREISTELCREKEDLVFLVLGHQPPLSQEEQMRTNPFNTSASGQQDFVILPPPSTASPTSHDASPVSADPTSSSLAQEHREVQSLTRSIFCTLVHPYYKMLHKVFQAGDVPWKFNMKDVCLKSRCMDLSLCWCWQLWPFNLILYTVVIVLWVKAQLKQSSIWKCWERVLWVGRCF